MTTIKNTTLDLLCHLSMDWAPGPNIPERFHSDLTHLCDRGLIEREFMDESPPVITEMHDGFTIGASACWHYRLTHKGAAHKQALLEEEKESLADPLLRPVEEMLDFWDNHTAIHGDAV